MQWLREGWDEIRTALGVRRYVIGALVTAAVGAGGAAYIFFTGAAMSLLAKVLLAILVVVIFVFVSLLDHTIRLRRQITPKLLLDFDPATGCLVQSPLQIYSPGGQLLKEFQTIYLRARVRNIGGSPAKDCEPMLTGIARKRPDGSWDGMNYHDSFDLPWALRGDPRQYSPTSIGPNITRYIDVLLANSDTQKIHIVGGWPLRHRDAFNDPATYRITVTVVGEGVSSTINIIVEWTGVWDQIKAYQENA